MHIVTIVGNRPQFIKAAALSPLLRAHFTETLIHTGQHYDADMSDLFFRELGIPDPDVRLEIPSGPARRQLDEMTRALETEVKRHAPDCVLVYGDTNSTLAGVLAAVRNGIPVAHVEAGARSYNQDMPEEHNRIVADQNSELLLCSSVRCRENLTREGIARNVFVVGDLMYDQLNRVSCVISGRQTALEKHAVASGAYVLVTIHRPSNTDTPRRLDAILNALERAGEQILWPVHPRCDMNKIKQRFTRSKFIYPISPQGYLDFLTLAKYSRLVVTDSGGVQKEAYWLGVPCLTLREETEWMETVEAGWNLLVGASTEKIAKQIKAFRPVGERPPFYGDGNAAKRILEVLSRWWQERV